MRRIILTSHGNLAEGMLHSLEMIMGKQPQMTAVSAYLTPEDDLKLKISSILAETPAEDELIIVTDLFGGSVNNCWMLHLDDPRVQIISGMNLGILVELASQPDTESISTVLENACEAGRNGIRWYDTLEWAPAEEGVF